ncbi:MAG: methyl-accepting chemotaxis protein [Gammaproteobacteria bacterium]|nr:methyl-accepting chemotaxis protein [Gammaproteobacteria bacterium]
MSTSFSNSISKKFLAPTLLLTLVSLVGLGAFLITSNNASIEQTMDNKSGAMANLMAQISVPSYQNFDFLALEQLVKQMVADPEVEFAVFYDAQKKSVTKTSEEKQGDTNIKIYERAVSGDDKKVLGMLRIGYSTKALQDNLRRNVLLVIGGIVIALILMSVGLMMLVRTIIVRRVQETVDMIKNIGEGEGDLTKRLTVTTSDEIGELGKGFNKFVDKLQTMIKDIGATSDPLTRASDSIASVSNTTLQNVAMQQQKINSVATAMTEMVATVQNSAQSALAAADAAKRADADSRQGQKVIDESIKASNLLAEEVQRAAEVINRLSKDTDDVATVLDVIKGIAEQTNLLALNAAIEAARAGEQGRGFAVVADEVRTLAQRTQNSTLEIQQIIQRLQSAAGDAVTVMERGKQQAVTSVGKAGVANDSFTRIAESIASISDMTNTIASAAEEQSAAAETINADVLMINEMVNKTSEDAKVSSESSQEMAKLSVNLKSLVGRFRT